MSTQHPSGRRPVTPEAYDGFAMEDLANFLTAHHRSPDAERAEVAVARIDQLGLMQRADHRHGIAGALHALMQAHPQHAERWRRAHAKMCALADTLKPSDVDAEITIPAVADYLCMYAIVLGDAYTADRLVRLGHRKDALGDVIVLLLHVWGQHPIIAAALARATLTTTQPPKPSDDIPHEAIMSLVQMSGANPHFVNHVLYVGWSGLALVVRTPDGKLPPLYPTVWHDLPVLAQQATPAEIQKWRQIDANRHQP